MRKRLFISLFILICLPIHFIQAAAPVKILLVPGHDNQVWGAQYGITKEADMTLALATRLYAILKKDKRFEVHITRDSKGYAREFADYFANHRKGIQSFRDEAKAERKEEIENGDFLEKENVPHNSVSGDVSVILYGINKWADENKMDAVIHIHFNDYPRPTPWTAGTYKGFAIYMPEGQLANWFESGQLAANIFTELKKKYATSTYEKERGGLVPDQRLIALGSNGTLLSSVRSVLIEYGYIYRFQTKKVRESAYANMSKLTAAGIKNYFFKK
jgi:N-acetylmuramoyl-L-alanine amidase